VLAGAASWARGTQTIAPWDRAVSNPLPGGAGERVPSGDARVSLARGARYGIERVGVTIALSAGIWTSPLAAQAPARGAVVGTVVAAASDPFLFEGAPVANAGVVLMPSGVSVRTDSAGRFLLSDLPSGAYRLVVRGVGWRQLEVGVELGAGDTTRLVLGLNRVAPTLGRVTVRERATGLTAAHARRAKLYGTFLDSTTLARSRGRRLVDVLSAVPGVQLLQLQSGGTVIAARRGVANVNVALGAEPRCYLALYVNGLRVYEPSAADSFAVAPPSLDGDQGLPGVVTGASLFDVSQLAGIEIYAGPAQLPGELRGTGNACGAVRIWTKNP
jgi:hypothetical protein